MAGPRAIATKHCVPYRSSYKSSIVRQKILDHSTSCAHQVLYLFQNTGKHRIDISGDADNDAIPAATCVYKERKQLIMQRLHQVAFEIAEPSIAKPAFDASLFPPILSNDLKALIIHDCQEQLHPSRFVSHPCAVCQENCYDGEWSTASPEGIDFTILRNEALPSEIISYEYDINVDCTFVMNVITSTLIMCFYPKLTLRRRGIYGRESRREEREGETKKLLAKYKKRGCSLKPNKAKMHSRQLSYEGESCDVNLRRVRDRDATCLS